MAGTSNWSINNQLDRAARGVFARVITFFAASLLGLSIEAACTGNLILNGTFYYAEPGCSDNALFKNFDAQSCCGSGCPAPTSLPFNPPPASTCVDGPLPYSYVLLYENGSPLAETWTDSSGAFEFCLDNQAPQSSNDYQVQVYVSDFFSTTLTDTAGSYYFAQPADVATLCTGSARWDIVDRRSPQSGAEHIFNYLADDAFFSLINEVGWINNLDLQVLFPSSATRFSQTFQVMEVASGDEQDPDVLLRAYSFFALNQLYDQTFPVSSTQCGATGWGILTHPGCAWINGAALFLQGAMQDDPVYEDTPAPGQPPTVQLDLELPTTITGGSEDEGAIAATLWDIRDNVAEAWDTVSFTLDDIWSLIEQYKPGDVCSFRRYFHTLRDPTGQTDAIFTNHGITDCPPGTDAGIPSKDLGEIPCTDACGNPLNLGVGNKFQRERDFSWHDLAAVSMQDFVRYYNSSAAASAGGFGANWRSTFSRSIYHDASAVPPEAHVSRADGKIYKYTDSGGAWTPDGDVVDQLQQVAGGWSYTSADNTVEQYDMNGVLQSIIDIRGNTQTLNYDGLGRLLRVDANTGEFLDFSYDSNSRVASITDHTGRSWAYQYDNNGNLEFVTNVLDGTARQYHYEDAVFAIALTGITDERGIRYATFGYDAQGRANLSTHAGNAGRVDIVYNADGTRDLTNSLGHQSNYTTTRQLDVSLVTGVSGPGCATCGGNNSSYQYDPANNKLVSVTENGVTTQYGNYDGKGQHGFRIDAVGTPEQRRIDYTYDSRFYNRITSITEPSIIAANPTVQCTPGVDCKVTAYTYDAFGNRVSEIISGFAHGGAPVSRTISWAYTGPLNQLSQVDGPRTSVPDITQYRYYPDSATEGYNRARVLEIEDATGVLVRSNIQYTATGKVASEQRPNGLALSFTYYPGNDRLETLTETGPGGSRVTHWTYLPSGEVLTITTAYGTADATTLTFGYDNARRLTRITDGLGNYIEYTLDTEGNRLEEKTYDASATLRKQLGQTFDTYNRLDTSSQANEAADFDFAPDGTLDLLTDGRGSVSDYGYDALRRLTQTVQDQGGTDPATANATISYGYDVQDRLVSVTDPVNGNTTYTYDDLRNLLAQSSSDTGMTAFQYDDAGNLKQKTDALGQVFTYSYDALNRLTGVDAPSAAVDIGYAYDGCAYGVGRLCAVIYGSGVFPAGNQVHYQYNAFGDLVSRGSLVYGYDSQGRVISIGYPSGAVLEYGYDAAGQVDLVNFSVNDTMQTLAGAIGHVPFGPLTSLGYGNGLTLSQSFDTAYRMTAQTIPGVLVRTYPQYDANGNRLQQTDALSAPGSFAYDVLNRLDSASGPFGTRDYGYDKNGNRVQLVDNGTPVPATYEPNSNRMDTFGSANVVLDANGNTVTSGTWSYGYTPHNRLSSATDSGMLMAGFSYNGLGQRVGKQSAASRYFLYGTAGELLVEADGEGNILLEYLYLDGQLLAVFSPDDDQDGQSNQQEAGQGTLPANTDGDGDGLTNLVEWFEYGTDSANIDSDGDGAEDGWEVGQGTNPLDSKSLPPGDGDINRDGQVNAGDLLLLYQFVLGARTPKLEELVHADMNLDGQLNLQDVLLLQQLVLQAWFSGEVLLTHGGIRLPHSANLGWIDRFIEPVHAVPANSGVLYYVHNDPLGTPQAMTDESGNVVWNAEYKPFGKATINQDVDGDGIAVELNVRFPGQYEDGEAGLHYNYYRYFVPETGRYLIPDPLGLLGGSNLYAYSENDPVNLIDPYGLHGINLSGDGRYDDFLKGPHTNIQYGNQNVGSNFIVFAHGTSDAAYRGRVQTGEALSAQQLADLIKNSPDYNEGDSIFLTACYAGQHGVGSKAYAQLLSDILGVDVIASTGRNKTTVQEIRTANSITHRIIITSTGVFITYR